MTVPTSRPAKAAETSEAKADFPMTGFVRLKQILAPRGPLPISRSGFWAGVKSGRFPKARKISAKVSVWRAEEINALLAKIDETAR